ncbi:hypothetical protein O0235_10525 [Tepidiforma flava]|uniref:Uncharacterized protein n=1 Tax=Tepidiforma flava TaxID=3004094 RepID=A0ABY7M4H7_9CHLR|nr:hypothetical protein [Tepidiforma flava]WBL35222.1 hypothetical protein O0235_10525 [Tepidiforma flava]
MTGATVTMISSRRPASQNCPTRSPPPTSQMSRPAAAAAIPAWTGRTSPWTKRISPPGGTGKVRWVKTQVGWR